MKIKENIQRVWERIDRACCHSSRNVEDIQLVAVSKTVEVDLILESIQAGVKIIGENRVQEALPKFDKVGPQAKWHMIGHLQTNKVKKALEFADMIQSVDSLHVAKEIQKRARKADRRVDVLVEVNTSGEASKYGFAPDETIRAIEKMSQYSNMRIKGLMTIGPFLPDPEDVRPSFSLLRRLRDEVENKAIPGVEMRILSMGMTDDFEVAIEEGSNMVRIGRAIFGDRPEH